MRQFGRDPADPARTLALEPPRGRAARRGAGRARRRRQLHPPGHRSAADVRHERGPRALPARDAVRRRVLRRGDGLRVGSPDLVRRARSSPSAGGCTTTRSTTARRTCGTRRRGRTARRCCAYLPIVMAGPAALGRRRDDPPRHRDPRGHRREPAHPVLPGARVDVPVRDQRSLTRPPPTSSTRSAIRSRK